MSNERIWNPVETAPFMTVVWVRNSAMEAPVKATRGHVVNGAVHPNLNYFTSVFTSDDCLGFPAGRLVCPKEWAHVDKDGQS